MSRPLPSVLAGLVAMLPPGWVLRRRGGVLDAVLEGIAAPIADVEAGAEALMDEVDPRTANALLADFERVLGPDPCGADLDGLRLADRRRLAHGRWTALGGQSIPYLISVAAKRGVRIEIEEFWPSRAGRLRAGQRLQAEGCQFVWRVRLAPLGSWKFRAGVGQAGQPLGGIVISGIECELRRIAHAHTIPVFSYTLTEPA